MQTRFGGIKKVAKMKEKLIGDGYVLNLKVKNNLIRTQKYAIFKWKWRLFADACDKKGIIAKGDWSGTDEELYTIRRGLEAKYSKKYTAYVYYDNIISDYSVLPQIEDDDVCEIKVHLQWCNFGTVANIGLKNELISIAKSVGCCLTYESTSKTLKMVIFTNK